MSRPVWAQADFWAKVANFLSYHHHHDDDDDDDDDGKYDDDDGEYDDHHQHNHPQRLTFHEN